MSHTDPRIRQPNFQFYYFSADRIICLDGYSANSGVSMRWSSFRKALLGFSSGLPWKSRNSTRPWKVRNLLLAAWLEDSLNFLNDIDFGQFLLQGKTSRSSWPLNDERSSTMEMLCNEGPGIKFIDDILTFSDERNAIGRSSIVAYMITQLPANCIHDLQETCLESMVEGGNGRPQFIKRIVKIFWTLMSSTHAIAESLRGQHESSVERIASWKFFLSVLGSIVEI